MCGSWWATAASKARYKSSELLDELHRKEWSLFLNFCCPVTKHLCTKGKGSCKRRIYDQPATPLARLKACPQTNPVQIARLDIPMAGLDPFGLKEKIEQKLRCDFAPTS